ncbi:YbcC family protein [Noviherbaspirillum pedocola]
MPFSQLQHHDFNRQDCDVAPTSTGQERKAHDLRIEAACAQACERIAPAWPLDGAIAVNPHWQRIGMPLRRVAARMALLADIPVFPPRSHLREAWEEKRIGPADLDCALATLPAARAAGMKGSDCIDALNAAPCLRRLPLLIDLLDDDPARQARLDWRQAITHQVSQVCAAYFDECQADWQPERASGLYAFWRDTLTHDHGIGMLMGVPGMHRWLDALPPTRADAERWVLQRLGLPEDTWADYLEALLLTVNGWASWCAYLGWQARQEGRTDAHLRDLLAIRLAWGAILLECKGDAAARRATDILQRAWSGFAERMAQAEDLLLVDEVWQLALEAHYQRGLAGRLTATPVGHGRATEGDPDIEVQAAFCIDVRSEPLRRALENLWPAIRTVGFAGFFGLPIAYTPLGTQARRPQLPGLLAPAIEAEDCFEDARKDRIDEAGQASRAALRARRRRFAWSAPGLAASRWPNAAFSFVEATGVAYAGKLARWLRQSESARVNEDMHGLPARYHSVCRPALSGLDPDAKVDLAARVLKAMGLAGWMAPLVLLVGHGSQSSNNAHAAALDCGACCGQTGEVNARALAQLLNAPEVREGLPRHDIRIPGDTVFVAALHNTTTDEIEAFDLDRVPSVARARWERLRQVFDHACDAVRRERAPRLGLDPATGHRDLLAALRRRANDGAETRPEWGLAGNASLIIAPRRRTRSVVLDGRSFLHDYQAEQDPDGSLLQSLMTAPMLVAHWINWQYHASVCAPQQFGSGNKLLHNVVGGRIGVFEGNGGDLRIGLSRQSLHDGERCMHAPLRLTVVIDAPSDRIERVLREQKLVSDLIENDWLHLWRYEGERLLRYAGGNWCAVRPDEAAV